MVRARIYLLTACSMLLGIVMGSEAANVDKPLPTMVYGYSLQCQARQPGSPGACSSQNIGVGGGFRCDKVYCALPRNDGSFLAVETGKAVDGTECRNGRWCMNGQCVLAGDAPIPAPVGPGPKYKCQDPLKIRVVGTYRPPTLAPPLTSTLVPRAAASEPSTSSGTSRTRNGKNRATDNPTPGSSGKRKKSQ